MKEAEVILKMTREEFLSIYYFLDELTKKVKPLAELMEWDETKEHIKETMTWQKK